MTEILKRSKFIALALVGALVLTACSQPAAEPAPEAPAAVEEAAPAGDEAMMEETAVEDEAMMEETEEVMEEESEEVMEEKDAMEKEY